MRLPFFGRTLSWFVFCALTGCSTFDRPIPSRTDPLAARDELTRRTIDEANRKAQQGDVAGAMRLLDQLEEKPSRPNAGRASLQDADIDDVVAEVRGEHANPRQSARANTTPSIEQMIDDLVQSEPPARRENRRREFEAMSPVVIRQLHRQVVANERGNSSDLKYATEPVVVTPETESSRDQDVATRTAPDPRGRVEHANHSSSSGKNAPSGVVHALGSASANGAQPTDEIVQVGGSGGVSLLGIQPDGDSRGPTTGYSTMPTQSNLRNAASTDGEMPTITPANPGSTQMVITPRGGTGNPASGIVPTQGLAGSGTVEPANRTTLSRPDARNPRNQAPQAPGGLGPLAVPNGDSAGTSGAIPGTQLLPPGAGNFAPAFPTHSMTKPQDIGKTSESNVDTSKGKRPNVLQGGVTNFLPNFRNQAERAMRSLGPEATPAAATTWQPTDINSLIASLESQLASAAPGQTEAERLEYVRRQVNLRFLYMIAGQQDQALEPIRGLDANEQEFWQQLFWGISNYFDAHRMPRATDRATQTLNQLRHAIHHLKPNADLEVRNVAFCQKIDSYGNYERSNREKFPAGLPVLLYAEVDNFRSMPSEGDRYMTTLKSTIEFYKARGDGKLLASIPFDINHDYCRNQRRDYFLAFEFAIPQQLEPGSYTLVLRVEDQLAQKVADAKVNFLVE